MAPSPYKTLLRRQLRVRSSGTSQIVHLSQSVCNHFTANYNYDYNLILRSVLRLTTTTCSYHPRAWPYTLPNLVILLVSQFHLYLLIQVNTNFQDIYHISQYLRYRRPQEFHRLLAILPMSEPDPSQEQISASHFTISNSISSNFAIVNAITSGLLSPSCTPASPSCTPTSSILSLTVSCTTGFLQCMHVICPHPHYLTPFLPELYLCLHWLYAHMLSSSIPRAWHMKI